VSYRALAASLLVAGLTGCGARTTVTTQGPSMPRPLPVPLTCSRSDRRTPPSKAPGAQRAVVPGHPQAVLLCRYSGLNGHPRLALIRSRAITNTATVAHLADELNALPKQAGAINCPADFGDAVMAWFQYSAGPGDPVQVGLSGCQDVTNGHLNRSAGPAQSSVAGEIDALIRR
jgi:hypothetical protein